jgi:hypothetical protein
MRCKIRRLRGRLSRASGIGQAIWLRNPPLNISRMILLCVVSFLGTSFLVRAALNRTVPDRLEVFANVKAAATDAETNVLFAGTSRIEFGIRPDVFDQETSVRGIDTHSYNIGEGGMGFLESVRGIEKFFELKPCCIKYIFFEPDYTSVLIFQEPSSLRAIDFFDIHEAYDALRFMEQPIDAFRLMKPAEYTKNISISVFRHYSNIGLFHSEGLIDRSSTSFRGYPVDDEHVHQSYSSPEAEVADYLQQVHRADATISDKRITEHQLGLAVELARYVRAKGAELILLRPPQISLWGYASAFAFQIEERCYSRGPFLFNFGTPKDYPALFDPANRFDDDHLNIHGAAIFSRMIADRFAYGLMNGGYKGELCALR